MNKILLLLCCSTITSIVFADCARAINQPTSPPALAYVFTAPIAANNEARSGGAIICMRQDENGICDELSTIKLPAPWYAISAAADLRHDRLYVVLRSTSQSTCSVARFDIGSNGKLIPCTPFFLSDLHAIQVDVSHDGQYLFAESDKFDTIELFEIAASGKLKYLSKSTSQKGGEVVLGCFSIGTSNSFLYAPEIDQLSGTCSVLELKIGRSANLISAGAMKVSGDPITQLILDDSHKLAFACLATGDIVSYAMARDGQLAQAQLPSSNAMSQVSENSSADSFNYANDDLVPIFPAPPLTDPELSVNRIAIDETRQLLFGFGGEANNEIDTWQITSSGKRELLSRCWFDKGGIFNGTDPRAHRSNDSDGLSSIVSTQAFIDQPRGYLYVVKTIENVQNSNASSRVFCFGILPSGKLRMVSSAPFHGADSAKAFVTSLYLLSGFN
jgi:hypothetical protein